MRFESFRLGLFEANDANEAWGEGIMDLAKTPSRKGSDHQVAVQRNALKLQRQLLGADQLEVGEREQPREDR